MESRMGAEFFAKGMEALGHDHLYLARVCFEHAVNEERLPAYCSYLALALAKSRGEYHEAIALAQEAVDKDPVTAVHYLNLGRIYLLSGREQEAVETFRQGVQYDRHPEIIAELDLLVPRTPSVFPSLRRDHPLNKYLGLFLAYLGRKGPKSGG